MLQVATHVLWHLVSAFLMPLQNASGSKKLSKEVVASQCKVDTKKFATCSSRKRVWWRTINEGFCVNEEDIQPDTVDLYARGSFTTLAFLYAIHTRTSYNRDRKEMDD